MIKNDLIRLLNEKTACYKLTQKDVGEIVDELFSILVEAFERGENVLIRGFGHFRVKYRKPRAINHPGTKKVVTSHPKYMINFDPAKNVKRKLRLDPTKKGV